MKTDEDSWLSSLTARSPPPCLNLAGTAAAWSSPPISFSSLDPWSWFTVPGQRSRLPVGPFRWTLSNLFSFESKPRRRFVGLSDSQWTCFHRTFLSQQERSELQNSAAPSLKANPLCRRQHLTHLSSWLTIIQNNFTLKRCSSRRNWESLSPKTKRNQFVETWPETIDWRCQNCDIIHRKWKIHNRSVYLLNLQNLGSNCMGH